MLRNYKCVNCGVKTESTGAACSQCGKTDFTVYVPEAEAEAGASSGASLQVASDCSSVPQEQEQNDGGADDDDREQERRRRLKRRRRRRRRRRAENQSSAFRSSEGL
ncbi:hypothetical protein AMELA_G00055140 [Ameiurus melas]|uniref:Uncharacterized protein n=1 Tax=Ameiurus melas TaxID=219545 RepID=A0A7J6B6T5_AMEME|nr:hypothetical protein AMELA_G00055140 [Ameiurus melas]